MKNILKLCSFASMALAFSTAHAVPETHFLQHLSGIWTTGGGFIAFEYQGGDKLVMGVPVLGPSVVTVDGYDEERQSINLEIKGIQDGVERTTTIRQLSIDGIVMITPDGQVTPLTFVRTLNSSERQNFDILLRAATPSQSPSPAGPVPSLNH